MAVFQSTHPVWGATFTYVAHATVEGHFNPRTPCGVRPDVAKALGSNGDFNPRTPCGVRPCRPGAYYAGIRISIHAPRVGCDP